MGPMGQFVYNSDDGNAYKMKLDASNAQATGGQAADGTELVYPRGWYPRYLLAQRVDEDTGAVTRRKVPCPVLNHATWLGTQNTIDLQVASSLTAVTFDITGRFGEKRTSRSTGV